MGDGGMTKLYLIRHAEAEGNLYRIAHGHCNGLITNYRGYQQIDALRERFSTVDIDAVYASDLYRTQITARAVWLPKSLPLHLVPAFREICMGAWENHTWHELHVKFPEQMYNFNRRADLWRVEGAETAQQVVDRFIPALEQVARQHEGEAVAVFSHGMTLRTVLGVLQGQTLAEVGQTPHGDNTAVSLVEWENGKFRVVYRDDNSHLTERGLSTFAKQSWWRGKGMTEQGESYAPLIQEQRRALGVTEGEATGIWYGEALVGAFAVAQERDALRLTWYGLLPEWRGRGLGIPPLGQAVNDCLRRGLPTLRLSCTDRELRRFFARLGFVPTAGDEMEKDVRRILPPIPAAYRP